MTDVDTDDIYLHAWYRHVPDWSCWCGFSCVDFADFRDHVQMSGGLFAHWLINQVS